MSYKILGSYALTSNVSTYTMQDWSTEWGQGATSSPYDRIEIWYTLTGTGTTATVDHAAFQFTDTYGQYGTSITWTDGAGFYYIRNDGSSSGIGATGWGGLFNNVYNNGNAVGLQTGGWSGNIASKTTGVVTIYNTKNLNSSPIFLKMEGASVYDPTGAGTYKQITHLTKIARNTSGLQLICGVKVGITANQLAAGSRFVIYGIK